MRDSKSKSGQISFLDDLSKNPEEKIIGVPAKVIEKPIIPEKKIWTITELSKDIRDQLKNRYEKILVKGEICDFKGVHRSGHLYMGIKDDSSQLKVVMWKAAVQKLPFELKMGLEVIITGSIDYYGSGASLQMVAEHIEPLGIGSLQLKFEQLKEKLSKEGLFDVSRKKAFPKEVHRIALVTGKSTAALQDMLRIFRERYPLIEICLFHASVQGDQAPKDIVSAIKKVERYHLQHKIDILIVGRGGGSYEDLFCFNDETLARTIAACPIPTVSAVGHEIDFTISDFVADRRAATPTHAAQESVPDIRTLKRDLFLKEDLLKKTMMVRIYDLSQKIDSLLNRIMGLAPHQKLKAESQLLEAQFQRLQKTMRFRIENTKARLARLSATLDALSPLKVLERGYSVIQNAGGEAIRSIKSLKKGDEVSIKLSDGNIKAAVTDLSN